MIASAEINCNCLTSMDVRGRCCPIKSALTFKNCPAKYDTLLFILQNDYEDFTKISNFATYNRKPKHNMMKEIAKQKYGLDDEELDELIDAQETREMDDEEYLCLTCDQFIDADDEGDCRYEHDTERLVCDNCVPLHFCEDCDEFVEDEMEKNPCGNYICECCEQDRKDDLADQEKQKEEKIEKLNKAIVDRWELIKNDMGDWVDEMITEKKRFTNDVERREDLINALNVICNELGQQVCDEYDN